jgi:predicted PurR-regulated permease PerM
VSLDKGVEFGRSTLAGMGTSMRIVAAPTEVAPDRDDFVAQHSELVAAPPSQLHVILQVLLVVAAVAFGLWALYELAGVVFVLILAALFAYVVEPLVHWAEGETLIMGRSHRLSRGAAVGVVYVALAGSVSLGALLLLPSVIEQVSAMISRAPMYSQSLLTWEHAWSKYYDRMGMPPELQHGIDQAILAAGNDAVESARGLLVAGLNVVSHLPWLILIPILAFFFLKDAKHIRRTIVIALPHRVQLRGHRLFEEMNATLAAYVRAQLLACVVVGLLCGLGFAVLGVPYPVFLGVLAAMLEFIPLVGPLVLAMLAAFVGALHAPVLALWVFAFLGILRFVEDYVIYPRLIRRGISLHPLAVIVAVLAGAASAGVAGVFLAVPVVAVASVAFRHWLEWRAAAAPISEERFGVDRAIASTAGDLWISKS